MFWKSKDGDIISHLWAFPRREERCALLKEGERNLEAVLSPRDRVAGYIIIIISTLCTAPWWQNFYYTPHRHNDLF